VPVGILLVGVCLSEGRRKLSSTEVPRLPQSAALPLPNQPLHKNQTNSNCPKPICRNSEKKLFPTEQH